MFAADVDENEAWRGSTPKRRQSGISVVTRRSAPHCNLFGASRMSYRKYLSLAIDSAERVETRVLRLLRLLKLAPPMHSSAAMRTTPEFPTDGRESRVISTADLIQN